MTKEQVIELEIEAALTELVDKICPGLDSGNIVDDAKTASRTLSAQQSGWTPVAAKLPEWAARDDFPCVIDGKPVNATLTSEKVLVTIAPHNAVRIDNLVAIEGGLPWWDNYGDRVIAWMPCPPAWGVGA